MKTAAAILALFAASTAFAAEDTIKSKVVDPTTNSVTETISDSKGKILKKTVFYFDTNNWTTGAVHYDTKGNVKYKESYKRNGAGQMTESYLYSPADQLLGHRVFSYDAKGGIAKIDDFDAAGRLIMKPVAAGTTSQGTTGGKKRR